MTRRFLITGLATLALAACESAPPMQRFPEVTFANLPKIGLNVAKIEVVSTFHSTLQPPHIEYLMPAPPEKVMRRWAADRLEAKGTANVARFTITDASATETPLPMKGGLTGLFTNQQAVRYQVQVAGMIEILDDQGFRRAFASARVSRSETQAESASINDRNRLWFNLVDALMKDFNAEMERDIRSHLGGYLM